MKKAFALIAFFAAIAAQAEFVRGWLTTTLPTGEETVEVEANPAPRKTRGRNG